MATTPSGLTKVDVVYPSVSLGGTYADNTIRWTNATQAIEVEIQYSLDGSSWIIVASVPRTSTYTHTISYPNQKIYYRIRNLLLEGEWSDYTDELSWSLWVDTVTETVSLAELYTESGGSGSGPTAFTDTEAETVTMTDSYADALITKTNVAYFLGTATGAVHQYGSAYHGDNGTAISSRWESKEITFDDQAPQYIGKMKTVDRIWLRYMDRDTATFNVSLSTDKGATWTTVSRSLGTGANTAKEANFDFRKTGRMFRIRVEEASSNKDFHWTDMDVEWYPAGDYFEIS